LGDGPAGLAAAAGEGTKDANRIPRVSINEILQRHAHETRPYIVKLDIEGSENNLFACNTEWVARTPVIIVALHDGLIPGTDNVHRFVEFIANCNRDFVYLEDSIFSINRELS
jgi:hypothetical protein